jgi:hypothetical protein
MLSMSAVQVTEGARMTKVAATGPAWKCRTITGTATLSIEVLRPTKNVVSETAASATLGDIRGAAAVTVEVCAAPRCRELVGCVDLTVITEQPSPSPVVLQQFSVASNS